MQLNIKDLVIDTSAIDSEKLLKAWDWLIPFETEIVMITQTGDAFLIEKDNGSILFLDTLDGELEVLADSLESFQQLLQDEAFVIDYFSCELIAPLLHHQLPPNTVYSFKTPPVLGGEYHSNNLEIFDVEHHFSDMGLLWQEIGKINIDEDTNENGGE
ncbi:T6SS immunity protein Tdi1 domain-containing protein [Advenella sp. RU8]|uniref:T6SS immunity protein Tdi1 domain-containing protein n=1 Tax=Advenella sp. RU8 TaxID=3399575 RepID=UPI003AAF3E09